MIKASRGLVVLHSLYEAFSFHVSSALQVLVKLRSSDKLLVKEYLYAYVVRVTVAHIHCASCLRLVLKKYLFIFLTALLYFASYARARTAAGTAFERSELCRRTWKAKSRQE